MDEILSEVIGREHDRGLGEHLRAVLLRLGAKKRSHDWVVAGSQEIETYVFDVGSEELTVETETYIGASLRGPAQLVRRIQAMLLERESEASPDP